MPRRVIDFALGARHTCAIVVDGSNARALHCWGANDLGQLGLEMPGNKGGTPDTIPSDLPPVPVPGELQMVAAGLDHTCAVTDVGQGGANEYAVYCWGSNGAGQLTGEPGMGLGLNPGEVEMGKIDLGPEGTGFVGDVDCGGKQCCAVLQDGVVKCWGDNMDGVVDPNNAGVDVMGVGPSIPFTFSSNAQEVAVGTRHACARSSSRMACWGANNSGQLGTGDTNPLVSTNPVPSLDLGGTPRAIAAGGAHSCVVLEGDGTVCWGWNEAGQLGDGTTMSQAGIPVNLNVIIPIGVPDDIFAAGSVTCAIGAGATQSWCWGANGNGQVTGNTVETPIKTPRPIGANVFTVVRTSGEHTCALTADTEALRCWGRNDFGQLGYGNTDPMGGMAVPPPDLPDIPL